MIIVGRFGAPFGVKGWIKVQSFTKPTENLVTYQPWQVELQSHWLPIDIVELRTHHQHLIALIKDCTSPEAATRYRNTNIGIYRSQLPKLDANEVYWSDLEGLTVHSIDGRVMGKIKSIFATGANDVLVVQDEQKQETLIPYLRDSVIKSIDLNQGIITVDWSLE